MPTIKDIAKIAGVSQGTVSNVLNRRGNVSTQKIRLVEDAMNQLGYTVNAPARQLRNNIRTSSTIAVMLPNIVDFRYSFLYSGIKWYLDQSGYLAQLHLTSDVPFMEQVAVNEILAQRPAGIIAVTSCSNPMQLYEPLLVNGGKIVFVERNHCKNASFTGYDFEKAGRDMANMVIEKKVSRVGLFTGLSRFMHESDFRSAFLQTMEHCYDSPSVRDLECDMQTADKTAYQFFAAAEYPEVIVTSSTYLANSVNRASSVVSSEHAPLIFTVDFDTKLDFTARQERYCMDYYALSKSAVDLLTAQLVPANTNAVPSAQQIILQPEGVKRFSTIKKCPHKTQLNIMTINGQGTQSLRYMAPYFTRKSNIELNIVALPPHEAFDNLLRMSDNAYFDIFRSNLAITPLIDCNELIPIDREVYQSVTATMIPRAVHALSYNKAEHYAVPMDVATQMLTYRKDLFDDSLLKRLYYEKTSCSLDLPHSFKEFNTINSFFCRRNNFQSPVLYGSTSALGTGSAILTNFLLRYRELKGFIRYTDGHLILDQEKAVAALESYNETVTSSIISNDSQWWDANVNNLVAGNTVMELISVNYAANLADFRKSQMEGRLGYGQVPGKGNGIGGGSFVISKKCKEPKAAMDFLLWACGYDQAEMFTYLGGTSPHNHVYKKSRILQLYPWYDGFEDTIAGTTDYIDWPYINRYELENLFGYVLRNVFHGILTCSQGIDMIIKQLDACIAAPKEINKLSAQRKNMLP